MNKDITKVRPNIMTLFAIAGLSGMLILIVTNLMVLHLAHGSELYTLIIYFIFTPFVILVLVILIYFYLRPIAEFAKVYTKGDAIPPELTQRARTLAFQAPWYFMSFPVLITAVAAILTDIIECWSLPAHMDMTFDRYAGSILIVIISAALSLIVGVVSRRLLAPVLLVTSKLAQDIGPRVDLRTRQFVMTFLLTFIAMSYLGVLGYIIVRRASQHGLQDKFTLLGDNIALELTPYLDNDTLKDYVQTLTLDDCEVFLLDGSAGEFISDLKPAYQKLEAVAGTVSAQLHRHPQENRWFGPLKIWNGEMLLVRIERQDTTWWLGFFYKTNLLNIPSVKQAYGIILAFVIIMFTLEVIITRYLSEDFSRDINYVTTRLSDLASGEQISFEKLPVFSLDEVGDLVQAFNTLLEKAEDQQADITHDKAELRALLEVTRDIGFTLDSDQLLAQIIKSVDRVFGYRQTAVFLVDTLSTEVYVAAYPEYLLPSLLGKRWEIDPQSIVGQVIQQRSPITVDNDSPTISYFPDSLGICAELAVPMLVGGEVIGVFEAVSTTAGAFSEDDRRIITAVADQAAVALQNAHLYHEVEEQRQTAASLAQLAKIVASSLDLAQVLDLALKHLAEIIDYDSAAILLKEKDCLVIAAGGGFADPHNLIGSKFYFEEDNLGYQVMRSQKVQVIPDVQIIPTWGHKRNDIEGAHTIRAWIGAPLVVEGNSLGLLTLDKLESNFYTHKDGQLATAFADQIALAVQNTRSFQISQDRAREMSLLNEISQRISTLLELEVNDLLSEIVERVSKIFGYQAVYVHLIDQTRDSLKFTAQYSLNKDLTDGIELKMDGQGIVSWVALHGESLLVPDVTQDPRYIAVAPGIHSELAIPLIAGDVVLGVFNLESEKINAFDDDDVRLMTALAHQITIALENARLFQSVRAQAKHLKILQAVSQKIVATLDIDQLLNEVCRAVAEAFGFEHVAILLVDDEHHDLYFGAQLGCKEETQDLRLPIYGDKGITTIAAATLRPVLVPDVSKHARYIAFSDCVRSELAIPLFISDRLVGVLNLESSELNRFNDKDVRLMTALGQQVTGALENARLFNNVRAQAGELAQMASNIADEKRKLDAILRNIADGLIVTDSDGKITLANPAFAYMFGKPAAALVDKKIEKVIAQRDLLRLIDSANRNSRASFTGELPMESGRTFKATASAIQEDNRVLGVATVVHDVSHEKEVDRMKTEFISTVSHELRTPLTSVLGFAKLIGRAFERDISPHLVSDNVKTARALKRIRDNLNIVILEGERLTRLINDVLDISKMESGKIEWLDQPFDFVTLIQKTLEHIQVRMEIEEKGLSVSIETEESAMELVADPDRIQQVLLNLLTNALKFTENGGISVALYRLTPGDIIHEWPVPDDEHGAVLCAITDTGIGIAEKNIPRLFRRFQQIAADALTNKPKGTGLGLAISREIVNHYGGIIWAESTEGHGSTFYFTLPFHPLSVAAQHALPLIATAHPQTSLATGSLTAPLILVVDDEPHIRLLLMQELEANNYQVIGAANGTEAITLARHHTPRPSLILLDIMLPDISGFDVLRILKADATTAEIPVVVVSIVEDQEQGLALGANEYLVKPIDTKALLKAITKLLTEPRFKIMAESAARSGIDVMDSISVVLKKYGFEVLSTCEANTDKEQPDQAFLEQIISHLQESETLSRLCFRDPEQKYTVVVLPDNRETTDQS